MPPKKAAAPPAGKDKEAKADTAAPRKVPPHPSTAVMVREAVKELDSRKGVSSQAIQTFIRVKYPSVDPLRLRPLVRRTLKKGLETGSLVRPAHSTVPTGATGKYRLAVLVKQPKPRGENMDPNVQKEGGAKKKKEKKKKKESYEEEEPQETKPAKKSKENQEEAKPAKKTKAFKAPEDKEAPIKSKASKPTKETKAGKVTKATKAAGASSDCPAAVTKSSGKRGKKAAE